MRLASLSPCALVATLFFASCAHADTLFSYTGSSPTGITDTLTFQAPTTPTPVVLSASSFLLPSVSGTFDQYTFTPGVEFGTSSDRVNGDGNNVVQPILILNGPQLWTGPVTDPTFVDGSYAFTGNFLIHELLTTPDLSYTSTGTLTVSTVTPEPSSFALLGTGLLGVAGVVKRRFA